MPSPLEQTLVPFGARTTSGVGAVIDLGVRNSLRLVLEVSNVSGTAPSLVVGVETSRNGVDGWRTLGVPITFVTAVGVYRKAYGDANRFVRAYWTIAGNVPNFSFEVAGVLLQVYANAYDFSKLGLPTTATAALGVDDIEEALEGASGKAASYLQGAEYTLPLSLWDDALRRCVSIIAAYDIMVLRGFDPNEYDSNFKTRYDEELAWLQMIADGKIVPGIIDSTPTTGPGPSGPSGTGRVSSLARRGW